MYGWKEGKNHQRNVYLTNLEDVILLDKKTFIEMMDVWYEKRDNTAQYEHPTQKPVALAGRAIRHSSKIGDIVLDLFGGSGSTLIAAEQLERKAYLMELDPYYCDVIRKRYAKFIGKEEAWEKETKPI
jgi:DNA modification methylase